MADHITRAIKKRAAEAYDLAVQRGDYFDCESLAEELVTELLADLDDDGSIFADLMAAAARTAVNSVDASRRVAPPQADLFDSMDQPVAVGGGRRIVRRSMGVKDWIDHLAYIGDNVARVNAAAAKENSRFSALAAYLADGMDTEAAAAAWAEANPGELLP